MVAVGRTEQVQNCGEATGVPIESFQLRIIGARSMGDPFHISIAGAGQNGEARKRLPPRRERRKICNQFLERLIETKILWFVGQIMDVAGPRGGPEFEPCDCLAAAMRVAEIGQNRGELRIARQMEALFQLGLIVEHATSISLEYARQRSTVAQMRRASAGYLAVSHRHRSRRKSSRKSQ